MDRRMALELVFGTVVAALIYSTIFWAVIIFTWKADGSWRIVSWIALGVWAFLFLGFSLRHIIGFLLKGKSTAGDESIFEEELLRHEGLMRGMGRTHAMLDEVEEQREE